MNTPTLSDIANALYIGGHHAEYSAMRVFIKERDALLAASSALPAEGTLMTPTAKELVALVLDYDLLQQSYIQDVAILRKQCALHEQHINELAAILTSRDEEIDALMAELSLSKGANHHAVQ